MVQHDAEGMTIAFLDTHHGSFQQEIAEVFLSRAVAPFGPGPAHPG